MTNEEFEQEIKRLEERIEDQINSLRIKFLESKADKKPYEVEVPEDIGNYYFVNECGAITLLKDVFFSVDYEKVYQRGLAFKTKEEAEQFDKERILIKKMKDWAKKYNDGWTPNWKNDDKEEIYEVQYDRFPQYLNENLFDINEIEEIRSLSILPYFYSYEIARKFIKEFGNEIKEVFC
jgi:hypothetical protein|nr:MAG TPA: hypothetical protein [Caudoviricetes sp.]